MSEDTTVRRLTEEGARRILDLLVRLDVPNHDQGYLRQELAGDIIVIDVPRRERYEGWDVVYAAIGNLKAKLGFRGIQEESVTVSDFHIDPSGEWARATAQVTMLGMLPEPLTHRGTTHDTGATYNMPVTLRVVMIPGTHLDVPQAYCVEVTYELDGFLASEADAEKTEEEGEEATATQ